MITLKGLSIFVAALIVGMTFTAMVSDLKREAAMISKVKSGETILTCLFSNGFRVVPKEKVTGFEHGYWKFDNGAASSCTLTEAVKP